MSIKEKQTNEFISSVASKLKQNDAIKAPEWAPFVKTGVHKEKPPVEEDWWYTRVAAILRTVALQGPVGVSKLRTKYGGRKNRGVKPEHHRKGSGSIMRKALQQLEAAKLVKQDQKGVHKGRVLTAEGKKLLNEA